MKSLHHGREVQLCFPGEVAVETVTIQEDTSLRAQIAALCTFRLLELEEPVGEDEPWTDTWLLIATGKGVSEDDGRVIVGDVQSLNKLSAGSAFRICVGSTFVQEQVERLDMRKNAAKDTASEHDGLRSILADLLRSLHASQWFAEEFLAKGGMKLLSDSIVLAAKVMDLVLLAGHEIVELVSECFCELLKCEECIKELQQCEQEGNEELFTADIIAVMISSMLAQHVAEDDAPEPVGPKAIMLVLSTLVLEFPLTIMERLDAALAEDDGTGSLYVKLVEAVMVWGTWRSNAAMALIIAFSEAQEWIPEIKILANEMKTEMLDAAEHVLKESDENVDFLEQLWDDTGFRRMYSKKHSLEDARTVTAQAACEQLEGDMSRKLHSVTREQKDEKEDETARKLETETRRAEKLVAEVRRANQSMKAMSKCINVGAHAPLQASFSSIVQFGVDSSKWENGGTALHYAAANVQDLAIVELFSYLAPNIDARDDQNLTAQECAQKKGRKDVEEIIQAAQTQRVGDAGEKTVTLGGSSGLASTSGKGKAKGKSKAPPAPSAAKAKGPGKGPPAPDAGKAKGKGDPGGPAPPAKEMGKDGTPGAPAKARFNLQPLWWTKLSAGKEIKDGQLSVWQHGEQPWEIPEEAFVERFSKNQSSAPKDKGPPKESTEKKDVMTIIRIVDEMEDKRRLQLIKTTNFPSPEDTAEALLKMDCHTITNERLHILKEDLRPNQSQVELLEKRCADNPGVPLATSEHYMKSISRVPAFAERIDCWHFIRNYEEDAKLCEKSFTEFHRIVGAFRSSTAVQSFLKLALQIGNLLNEGSAVRGDGEGFDLASLTKFDSVKDKRDGGKDARHFMAELLFLGQLKDAGEDAPQHEGEYVGDRLLRELKASFGSVNRSIILADGAPKVVKTARCSLEELEAFLEVEILGNKTGLVADFEMYNEKLKACLLMSDDPADPLRLELTEAYARAGQHIAHLKDQAKKARTGYKELLEYFLCKGMTSTEFILLFDDVLIPDVMMLNKSDAIRNREIQPRFCTGREITGDDMALLWDLGQRRKGGAKHANCSRGKSEAAADPPDGADPAAVSKRKRPPRPDRPPRTKPEVEPA